MLTTIIITVLVILGCALVTPQGNEYIYDKIYNVGKVIIKDETGKITDTIKVNHKFTTEIHGYLPDPCWEVYKVNVEELEDEFNLTPIAKREKARPCIQVIASCTTSVELIAKSTADTLKNFSN